MTSNPAAPDPDTLQRLLRQRLGTHGALVPALLQALFGHADLGALDSRERRRVLSLLESRDDCALHALAWRGDAGRSRLTLQLDVLFDGEASAEELRRMPLQLLRLLHQAPWPAATLVVRSVLLGEPEERAQP